MSPSSRPLVLVSACSPAPSASSVLAQSIVSATEGFLRMSSVRSTPTMRTSSALSDADRFGTRDARISFSRSASGKSM